MPTESFLKLSEELKNYALVDYAEMPIENNIAGRILQNYSILREYRFRMYAELYLNIHHSIMCLPEQAIEDVKEVHSRTMALNQCLSSWHKILISKNNRF